MRSTATFLLTIALAACATPKPTAAPPSPPAARPVSPPSDQLRDPREVHLADLRQLTFGVENAEAYWSFGGKELSFQSVRPPFGCDQIFRVAVDDPAAEPVLVSTGKGRTTCAYFQPGDDRILYASTHRAGDACPPAPDHSQGYVWPLFDSYDIYSARRDGSDLRPLIESPGYDAEATVCMAEGPNKGAIIFTSTRDGDLELYRADADGKNVKRLTHTPGYDGGAFFSPDCSKIVWRTSRPQPGKQLDDYKGLLARNLVRPGKLELWVANADGTEARQITWLGAASFAPSFHPSGERILFSSNYGDPKGREFDIWAIDINGTKLERITYTAGFDGFPLFSPDGTRLAFSSNRHQIRKGETDVYVARWVEAAPAEKQPETAADRIGADVYWLADDAREGRGVGTKGLEAAEAYLTERFQALGLEPAGDKDASGKPGYPHAFEVTVAVRAAATTALTIDGKAIAREELVPTGFSRSGEASGPLVAAGFGVTAPEADTDDYKGLDVKGKIVIVRRFVPEGGKWGDDKLQRRYGDLHYKAWNAREHGARGVIIVDAPVAGEKDKDGKDKPVPAESPLPSLAPSSVGGGQGDVGIPVVVVKRAIGAPLFADAKAKHKATIKVALEVERKPAHNLVGRITAGAPAAERLPGVVVVGAHYDHLGLGGSRSLAPESKAPHGGADDNASGTAGLMEIARALAARKAELRRDVIIMSFSAEEMGDLGSSAIVRRPPAGIAPKDIVAMLNLDMVGRLRENLLTVLGTESAAEWNDIVGGACERALLQCNKSGDGYGPSDHSPFYAAGVPVLHFFTGAHAEYHKPADRANLINAAGLARVALVATDVAVAVDRRDAKLAYKAVPAPPPMGDMRSYGASLGTIPDFSGATGAKPGVLLSGVRPGGPADQAGVRRGDLLVRIGKSEVRTIEDFEFVLRQHKPGEQVTIVVEREGKPLSLPVTFGARKR